MVITHFVRKKRRDKEAYNRKASSQEMQQMKVSPNAAYAATSTARGNHEEVSQYSTITSLEDDTPSLHMEMLKTKVSPNAAHAASQSIVSDNQDEEVSHYSFITSLEDNTPSQHIKMETNLAYSQGIHKESIHYYSIISSSPWNDETPAPIQKDNITNEEDYI